MSAGNGSIERFLSEIAQLQGESARLYLADLQCIMETEKSLLQSRNSVPRMNRLPVLSPWREEGNIRRGSGGLTVDEIPPRNIQELNNSIIWFDAAGRPWTNSAGQSMVWEPGWRELHLFFLTGSHATRASECLSRLNLFTQSNFGLIKPLIYPGRSVQFDYGGCWASVLLRVAELANVSTLPAAEWFVPVSGGAMSVEVWMRRDEFSLGSRCYSELDLQCNGEIPEVTFARRDSFWRDTELALEWIAKELLKPKGTLVTTSEKPASPESIQEIYERITGTYAEKHWKPTGAWGSSRNWVQLAKRKGQCVDDERGFCCKERTGEFAYRKKKGVWHFVKLQTSHAKEIKSFFSRGKSESN